MSGRVEVVNALIGRVGADLPRLADEAGLEGAGRVAYERGLGLPKGALAWGRFAGELAGVPVERVVARLERERAAPARPEPEATPAVPAPTAAELIGGTLAELGLEPRQTLWLTGSPDVRRELEAVGVAAPLLRSVPAPEQLRAYALAVMCRGPVGHKVTNPWTEAIGRLPRGAGPTLVHVASSNISGIARSFREQGEGLRPAVERWRAGQGR